MIDSFFILILLCILTAGIFAYYAWKFFLKLMLPITVLFGAFCLVRGGSILAAGEDNMATLSANFNTVLVLFF
jgi:hypothetical protein